MNLIPGEQSKWLMAIIEKFGLHFAPGATILYLGYKANKFVIYERERLEQLNASSELLRNGYRLQPLDIGSEALS